MRCFRVVMHGAAIALPFPDDATIAIGFHTTRDVRAADARLAQQTAVAQVLADWRGEGRFAAQNRGGVPTVTVDRHWPLGWFRALFGRTPDGYVFYQDE